MKKNKGITLIALVVTIIVLLILAGISINMLTGQNGILNMTSRANEKTLFAQQKEKNILNNYEEQISDYVGIDWEEAKATAKAPKEQNEERNNGVIGIGTDGKVVNMDLWKYILLVDGTYCLNDIKSLNETWVAGYKGKVINGQIEGSVPTYISSDEGKNWSEVSSMFMTFYNLEALTNAPDLPYTLKKGEYTFFNSKGLKKIGNLPSKVESLEGFFYGCESINEIPTLPNNVVDLTSTFFNCKNLINSPIIPKSVRNMHTTFAGCSKLVNAPSIPSGVENMAQTFSDCTALKTAPQIIPETVTNLNRTFQNCSNLTGTISINANVTGIMISGEETDYQHIFYNAVTNEGCRVQLTGACSILQNIIDSSENNNISLLVL